MARNKKAGNHPSYKKRGMSKASIAKKRAYDKKYASSAKRRKYRSELNKERRRRGIYGKGGGDVSHKKDGGYTRESSSKNRARNGQKKGASPKSKRRGTKK
jgi:hypothetical protein